MRTDPRDISKVWAIINIVFGIKLILAALWFGFLMFSQPDLPPMFVGDKFTEPHPTTLMSYWPGVALFAIGVWVMVSAILRLRARARIPRTAAVGTRRAAPLVERAAVPKLLQVVPGIGYRAFVAWRYLLVYHHRIKPVTWALVFGLPVLRAAFWLVTGTGLPITNIADPRQLVGVVIMATWAVVVYWGIVRYSPLAAFVFVFGLVFALYNIALGNLFGAGKFPGLDPVLIRPAQQFTGVAMLFGFILSFLAAFFGTLRGVFTFFTTVPIGGVWIGTSALVVVLAVMSGFETDLRDKILGSNAHIQITKEDGDFVEWREVKKKIDAIPGVEASTPYAVSEVVIAANNNGMNVIIKGIDPKSVGNVTDLVKDIEGESMKEKLETMGKLQPLIDLGRDRSVDKTDRNTNVDPPPSDMVTGGDPIDFSGGGSGSADPGAGSGSGSGSNGSGSGSGSGAGSGSSASSDDDQVLDQLAKAGNGKIEIKKVPAGDGDTYIISGTGEDKPSHADGKYGGDAAKIIGTDAEAEVLDILDSDLIRWMVGGEDHEPAIRVIDVPGGEPTLSRRTQALPGILVGRELVKQTHLYTGEEVRVVSPLSDPSNPDATGTPIPFNRDYRVAGVFYTGMYEYDLKFVYVTLDSLQDFLDLGDTVDGIEVRIENGDDTDAYVREGSGDDAGLIRKALGPGYRVQDWRELNRSLFSALKLEKIAMFLVLGIVILVASFSIIGNLIMVVVEKGREIALLKTLGASDTGVMQMFAVQGLIIGLIGTALGISSGLSACLAMEKFGLPLNPDVYYIDRLPIHVDPQSVIAAAITGVLISIAATLYPALLAARVRPSIGMRH